MKIPARLITILLFLIFWDAIEAQVYSNNSDTVYGFDPLLYNGRIYTWVSPRRTTGDPYLTGKEFLTGDVRVRGKSYDNLNLNYDIFNQQLLLKYTNKEGAVRIMEISKSWLETFRFDRMLFEYIPDGEGRIYQIFTSDLVKIRYFWKKDLKLDNFHGTSVYTYSKPVRTCSVAVNGTNSNYRNNREFVKAFPEPYRKQLVIYMRGKNLKVRKAGDILMEELVQFCNSLIIK
jgi:hypothetical protein